LIIIFIKNDKYQAGKLTNLILLKINFKM